MKDKTNATPGGINQRRCDKYLNVISELNRKHRQGETNIFDCGDLGFLRIWWHHQWHSEWFIPSKEFLK